MTDLDLAELERLAKAATSGPWDIGRSLTFGPNAITRDSLGISRLQDLWVCDVDREHPNAEFIAATDPDTVLALIARVRVAEARAERFDEVGAYAALREELSRVREAHTVHMQRANKRLREAEARIERVVRLRDRMERQRDDIDESVRLSMILADLNAALTEGDEQ